MLGLCGGVGMRDFFFDGDTSFDFDGEAGGVTGRSAVAFGPGLGSVKGGLLHISSLSLSDLSPRFHSQFQASIAVILLVG